MLTINSLVKTYKSKNRKSYVALDQIDLTLPDNGLVFLLGKSGSGKTTFLNLLGGLDRATSGEIIVDGKNLTSYSKRDLVEYRKSYVGFIFQDYCLIDDITVYDNISIALGGKAACNDNVVNEILKTVGLEGFGGKYPQELSGGERQRVAIARAIVKKPRIILADEPTGNLDGEATDIVFNLLKILAQNSLVFVVSHDDRSAYKYADRVIVLNNGRIAADSINQPNLVIMDSDGEKSIFPKENEEVECEHTVSPKKLEKHVRIRGNKFWWLFLKSKLVKIGLYSCIAAMIMMVMMLAQTITAFEASEVMRNESRASGSGAIFLTKTLTGAQKNGINTLGKVANSFPEIKETDIQAFRNAGYDGDIYSVLKCNLNISQSHVSAGMATNVFDESLYILEPLGVMVVDEAFLKEKYGTVEYIAKAKEFHPTGIIITDYLADIMLHSAQIADAHDYDSLLGPYHWGKNKSAQCVSRGYINGIIRTGYKEKYKSIFDILEKYGTGYTERISQHEDVLSFVEDIHTMYGLCYSLNPNFCEDALENPSWDMVWHYALRFTDGEFFTTDIPQVRKASFYGIELGENEVLMEMTAYNQVFEKEYTVDTIQNFKPHTETLSHYLYAELNERKALFTQDVIIAGLFVAEQNDMSGTFIAGDNIYTLFAEKHIYTTGLYFDDSDDRMRIIDTAAELGFQNNLVVGESLRNVTQIVEIFIPIFRIMAVILSISIIFILLNFSAKMINEKMKEIGVLKAIGIKNAAIGMIFGMQIFMISIFTGILSVLGYFLLVNKTNDLLINSLQMVTSEKIIPNLACVVFRTDIVLWNCILILILACISFIIPMIRIYRIDPVKIIRNKE